VDLSTLPLNSRDIGTSRWQLGVTLRRYLPLKLQLTSSNQYNAPQVTTIPNDTRLRRASLKLHPNKLMQQPRKRWQIKRPSGAFAVDRWFELYPRERQTSEALDAIRQADAENGGQSIRSLVLRLSESEYR
jgi:hypothetical protein